MARSKSVDYHIFPEILPDFNQTLVAVFIKAEVKMKILIKDHMQKNIITVFPSATLYDCTDLMTKHKVGSIVVIDDQEKPICILTKTDFIKALSETTLAITAGDFCKNFKHKEKVITISEEQSVFELLVIFTKKQIKHIPVVDNTTTKLKGIISSTDILSKLSELVVIDPLTRLANRRHISSVCNASPGIGIFPSSN